MRVGVTRTLPEALATAERVRALGHEPVVAPLLQIAPTAFDVSTDGAQALLFTSANGVRTFAAASDARALPVFTVGDASADAAQALGFAQVRSADGDVAALAALVARTLDAKAGKLIHIGGAHLAGDLAGALAQAGFETERRIAYQAQAVTALPEPLKHGLDLMLFHSARAAEIFVAFGAPNSASMSAACLSPAVAEAAQKAAWRRIIVAPAPREAALLDAALKS